MELLTEKITNPKAYPVKVVQFGEGNFLRCFVDYMIDIANEKGLFDGSIVLVKPITFGNLDRFHQQDCQYTVQLRGRVNGEPTVQTRVITSVSDAVDAYSEYEKYMALARIETLEFIVSNTTEAGIVYDAEDRFDMTPQNSYPGKLTKFLYERYTCFQGDNSKGLTILPVELIDDNGIALKKCVLQTIENWNLSLEFKTWVEEACVFASTLVDRIVTGYPREEAEEIWEKLGYQDNLLNTGEPFALWVIESEKDVSEKLPLVKAGLPVIFTDNQKPYKQRKVRILNGAHTSFVLAAYLAGRDFVAESMQDELICNFVKSTIYDEVIPTLSLPKTDLEDFASAVIDRFNNPFIKHALLAISLNSVSKWRARCMPSFLEYVEMKKELPTRLTFSIAALMAFYSSTTIREGILIGTRDGAEYEVRDDAAVLEFFAANSSLDTKVFVENYLSNETFHGQDLTKITGLVEQLVVYLDEIKSLGMRKTMEKYFQ